MAWAHTNGSGVVVGNDTNIKSFADLGGKQIAVPFWYSMHNIVLQYALRQSGITPVIKSQDQTLAPNECNLQVMGPPDMPAALAAKKIHGYIVAEPFNALGETKAGGRMLRFTGDIWKNHPCCVLCMHGERAWQEAEKERVKNDVRLFWLGPRFVAFWLAFFRTLVIDNVLYYCLIQAALRHKVATLTMDLLQEDLTGSVDVADATKIYAELPARRGCAQFPPALLERRYPLSSQAPFHAQNELATFLFGSDSKHARDSEEQLGKHSSSHLDQ